LHKRQKDARTVRETTETIQTGKKDDNIGDKEGGRETEGTRLTM
jgi:hypothetical protein